MAKATQAQILANRNVPSSERLSNRRRHLVRHKLIVITLATTNFGIEATAAKSLITRA